MAELLRMENISKRFGSFYANKNVTFDVQEGRCTPSWAKTAQASPRS